MAPRGSSSRGAHTHGTHDVELAAAAAAAAAAGGHHGDVSGLRRRSSLLLRADLSQGSMLGSHHTGHTSWPIATGHIITTIIGAGVLGLPHSMAWLGWVGGCGALLLFYVITLWCMWMLADVYEVKGRRHSRYKDAVASILGPRAAVVLSVLQHATMLLVTLGYHIAGAESLAYIAGQACQMMGKPQDSCMDTYWVMAVIFGAMQMLTSQLPNLEAAWWTSLIGAAMSFGYSAVAIALGASQASQHQGSVAGHPGSPSEKAFGIFNALGALGASYSCAIVLIEIEDTLREPPKASVSMKKAVNLGISITFVVYSAVSVLGYMALGDGVPGNILLGFRGSPGWVTLLGNLMVLIHMVSAYQVLAQPLFASIEDILLRCCPSLANVREWLVRAVYRCLYVAVIGVLAVALPFFSSIVGLIGAISYWPTAVLFPMLMYRAVHQPRGAVLWLMHATNGLMGAVALMAVVGAVLSIAEGAAGMKPFQGSGNVHG
ncbi:hypothetical protein OEZ85_000240 [Tetradesmus obliquus]|uniref:Amino acid transporter transmembrane domain-containing protein n=1 Tax=Tetradesmus obliquus TaxID=3088 RepID=A0ABY8UT34_TETOB|nr:hypothetical protein OEZ85_000240 [Tetradesmus obliquus]